MKKALICCLFSLLCAFGAFAETFINLTPAPKEMTVGEGQYILPAKLSVAVKNLPDSMVAECQKFVNALNKATGLDAKTVMKPKAQITVKVNPAIAPEGYTLEVGKKGVTIESTDYGGDSGAASEGGENIYGDLLYSADRKSVV